MEYQMINAKDEKKYRIEKQNQNKGERKKKK